MLDTYTEGLLMGGRLARLVEVPGLHVQLRHVDQATSCSKATMHQVPPVRTVVMNNF